LYRAFSDGWTIDLRCLFFWLFNFSALPLSDPEMKRVSGGEGLLDLRFYYSAQEAFLIGKVTLNAVWQRIAVAEGGFY